MAVAVLIQFIHDRNGVIHLVVLALAGFVDDELAKPSIGEIAAASQPNEKPPFGGFLGRPFGLQNSCWTVRLVFGLLCTGFQFLNFFF